MTICGEKLSGVCIMGKCPQFKKCCNVLWDKTPYTPQTNDEWRKTCSTEEFADFLFQHGDCIGCPANREICHKHYDDCKTAFLEWLKEKHND